MATRSPVPIHNFWGAADSAGTPWTAGTLPNVGAGQTPLTLQAGDFAYVTGDATFYVCTNPGTVGGANATWVPIQTGIESTDHFSPRWIVGNTLAGDPNIPQLAPFRYIPDPGDGSGIAQALAEATAVGQGDILVRSGTYTLPAGLVPVGTAIFDIPSNVTLRGAGWETQIIGPADQRAVFKVNELGTLADIKIVMSPPVQSPAVPTGDLVVELAGKTTGNATARNVYVDASLGQSLGTIDSLIGGIGSLADVEGGTIGARALDCVVLGNVYSFAEPNPPRQFHCYSFPDADQAIIRGQGLFGDYLLDLTGNSSRCMVDLQGENYRTAKIGGTWHQCTITSITFFSEFDLTPNQYAVECNGAALCAMSLVLSGADNLGATTALVMDANCVGNRVGLTCQSYRDGARVGGKQNVLSGISVEGTGGPPSPGTTGIDFTGTSENNVLIGGVLNAVTPIVNTGISNEIAHTV